MLEPKGSGLNSRTKTILRQKNLRFHASLSLRILTRVFSKAHEPEKYRAYEKSIENVTPGLHYSGVQHVKWDEMEAPRHLCKPRGNLITEATVLTRQGSDMGDMQPLIHLFLHDKVGNQLPHRQPLCSRVSRRRWLATCYTINCVNEASLTKLRPMNRERSDRTHPITTLSH